MIETQNVVLINGFALNNSLWEL